MKKTTLLLLGFIVSLSTFSQADEVIEDGYKSYYVILITQKGEVRNKFKEGKGITTKINDKTVTGTWYFKSEPDLITVVDKKGVVLGDVSLNGQKTVKLESEVPKQNNGGMSFGVGIGPVGIATGGSGGPRYISYNMTKNKAVFDKEKETREDKIRREYAEKMILEQRRKAQEKQARKAKRKNK